MKYYSAKTVTQILGGIAQTLKNCDREGKLKPAYVKSNGYRYYSRKILSMIIVLRKNYISRN